MTFAKEFDFLTSDMHFGHVNINHLASRPFDSTEEMNEYLIAAWNDTVAPSDRVLVLGDALMGKISESLSIVARLNGRIELECGNHDRPHPLYGKTPEMWAEKYKEAGFATVNFGGQPIAVGNRTVLACHFPYFGDSGLEDRYVDWRPVDQGEFLIHGHVHQSWRQRGRMINVGVDAWGGRPVAIATVNELIENGECDLPPLAWEV